MSPSQPIRFPDCKCQRDVNYSPYRAYLTSATPYPGGVEYCFTFDVVTCRVDNTCCYSTLYKVELPFGESEDLWAAAVRGWRSAVTSRALAAWALGSVRAASTRIRGGHGVAGVSCSHSSRSCSGALRMWAGLGCKPCRSAIQAAYCNTWEGGPVRRQLLGLHHMLGAEGQPFCGRGQGSS